MRLTFTLRRNTPLVVPPSGVSAYDAVIKAGCLIFNERGNYFKYIETKLIGEICVCVLQVYMKEKSR